MKSNFGNVDFISPAFINALNNLKHDGIDADGHVAAFKYGGTIASPAGGELVVDTSLGNRFQITGANAINKITVTGSLGGGHLLLSFAATLTLTHNAPFLNLPDGANIATNTAMNLLFVEVAANNWQLVGDKGVAAGISGFRNLNINATGTTANIRIFADEIALASAAGGYKTVTAVDITLAGTAVGINGLDAGALAASTWYAMWVISNGITTAGLLSLSATAPTMPAGYIYKARVGWIRTDGTGNKYPLSFQQHGAHVQYVLAAGSNVTTGITISSGINGSATVPTWVAIGVSAFVPSTALAIALNVVAGTDRIIVAPNNQYGSVTSVTNPPFYGVDPVQRTQMAITMLLETTNIYYAQQGTGCINVTGWEDNL